MQHGVEEHFVRSKGSTEKSHPTASIGDAEHFINALSRKRGPL
jgi:hypothetical protein